MASSQNGNVGIWSGYTPGDNGWTTQHNNNWDAIDALLQATIKSATTTTPPGSPSNGDMYIVPAGATGAWSSQTNKLAVWVTRSSAWAFYTPKNGWQVYNQADGGDYLYNGTAWALQGSQKLNVSQDYISGLKMVWNSATSLSVTTGAAYVPSLGRLCLVNSTLTLSSLSLSASTFYHLYLYENAGTPTLELVTTAPAAAYYGTARAKTGDTSRRYIGSVLTDASGNVINFVHGIARGDIRYRASTNGAPLQVLTNGNATTQTNISCASVTPITANVAILAIANPPGTAQTVFISASDGPALSTTSFESFLFPQGSDGCEQRLDANQSFSYLYGAAPSSTGFTVRVNGYFFER